MSWVIVEINQGTQTDLNVIGSFETQDEAESVRRRRYLDRHLESPLNTSRWFRSWVRGVTEP